MCDDDAGLGVGVGKGGDDNGDFYRIWRGVDGRFERGSVRIDLDGDGEKGIVRLGLGAGDGNPQTGDRIGEMVGEVGEVLQVLGVVKGNGVEVVIGSEMRVWIVRRRRPGCFTGHCMQA